MGTFGNTFGNTFGTPQVASGEVPAISDIVVSDITDTGFTVTANVDPMGANTVVTILYGETNSYGQTQETVTGSPLAVAGSISAVISNLTPYTTYHFSIRAVNSTGTTNSLDMTQTTATPPEILDSLNFGHWVYSDDSNKRDASDYLYQLRDISKENSLGSEIFINGDMSSSTGWSLASGWSIGSGKLTGSSTGNANATKPIAVTNAIYRHTYTIDSITGSMQNVSYYPLNPKTAAGTYQDDLIATSTSVGIRKVSTASGVVDDMTAYRILGNHLVQSTATNQPKVFTGYIEFDGIDNYLLTAVTTDQRGSIYIVGQRVGVDSEFNVFNALDGFGEISGNILYFGRNAAGSSYYNVRIKEVLIRPSIDNSDRITAINNYYTNLL